MPIRDEANGDAKLAIERLRVRAEMRSAGEEELSAVIQQEAAARSEKPKESVPAAARNVVHILRAVDSWPKVFALAMILAAAVFALLKGLKIF
jgi:hypothetical protein